MSRTVCVTVAVALAVLCALAVHSRRSVEQARDVWTLECRQVYAPHDVVFVRECVGVPDIVTRRDGVHTATWRDATGACSRYVCMPWETLNAEPAWFEVP